jgi:hypothetical protein
MKLPTIPQTTNDVCVESEGFNLNFMTAYMPKQTKPGVSGKI